MRQAEAYLEAASRLALGPSSLAEVGPKVSGECGQRASPKSLVHTVAVLTGVRTVRSPTAVLYSRTPSHILCDQLLIDQRGGRGGGGGGDRGDRGDRGESAECATEGHRVHSIINQRQATGAGRGRHLAGSGQWRNTQWAAQIRLIGPVGTRNVQGAERGPDAAEQAAAASSYSLVETARPVKRYNAACICVSCAVLVALLSSCLIQK